MVGAERERGAGEGRRKRKGGIDRAGVADRAGRADSESKGSELGSCTVFVVLLCASCVIWYCLFTQQLLYSNDRLSLVWKYALPIFL